MSESGNRDMGEIRERQIRSYTRREIVAAGAGVAGVLAFGRYGLSPAFAAADNRPVDFVLRPGPHTVELGGRTAATWVFNGMLPGPELRVRQGDRVRIRVENGLPEETTVHWHGIRLQNSMDGVPGITQPAIKPGESFVYDFVPPDAGTYFFHPHVGLQLDRGLYGALIVEARNETLAYDRDVTIVLDDWLDGIGGKTPEKEYERLRRHGMSMGSMGGMPMGRIVRGAYVDLERNAPARTSPAGLANLLDSGRADGGDVVYPLFLMNGRSSVDPFSVKVKHGDRVRLRLINAAADTLFSFNVDQHPLTIVASDGQTVEPRQADAVVLGMGERADVLLDADSPGAYQIVANALGKRGKTVGILRYLGSRGSVSPANAGLQRPPRVASYADLRSTESSPKAEVTRTIRLALGMDMMAEYVWTIGGQVYPHADPIQIRRGEHVEFVLANQMTMPHPMHLHGNLFRLAGHQERGLLKDTVVVGPKQTTTIQLNGTNPGRWMFHCHNDYHMMSGMMRVVDVAA